MKSILASSIDHPTVAAVAFRSWSLPLLSSALTSMLFALVFLLLTSIFPSKMTYKLSYDIKSSALIIALILVPIVVLICVVVVALGCSNYWSIHSLKDFYLSCLSCFGLIKQQRRKKIPSDSENCPVTSPSVSTRATEASEIQFDFETPAVTKEHI